MGKDKTPPQLRAVSSLKELATASKDLKAACKELCDLVARFEKTLETFNLGISAWHKIAGGSDDNSGFYWRRDVGYTAFSGGVLPDKWYIAIRDSSGNFEGDQYEERIWKFQDAPPWMQIEASGKLPELFETLVERVNETTEKVRARAVQTAPIADALAAALTELEMAESEQ